jgi:hypothetical protein
MDPYKFPACVAIWNLIYILGASVGEDKSKIAAYTAIAILEALSGASILLYSR